MKRKQIEVDSRGLIDSQFLPPRLFDRRVKKVIVFDTETAPYYEDVEPYQVTGAIEYPKHNVIPDTIEEYEWNGKIYYKYMTDKKVSQIIFDIGYTVSDKHGNIFFKRRHLIKEVFTDYKTMKHAYYFSKYPEYLMDLSDGKVQISQWLDVIQTMEKDIFQFGIKEIYAYNMAFDKKAFYDTHRLLTGHNFHMWEMYDIKENCLWYMSAETVLSQKSFLRIALEENWLTPSGNIQTSAEVCYRYITQVYDFEEEHTALSDAIIETAILARCYATKKRMTLGIPRVQPWLIVKNKALEYGFIEYKEKDNE